MPRFARVLAIAGIAISLGILRPANISAAPTAAPAQQCSNGLCISADQTTVPISTSVTLTADVSLTEALYLGEGMLVIYDQTDGAAVAKCQIGPSNSLLACTTQVSSATPQARRYVAEFIGNSSSVPIKTSPAVTVTWGGGGSSGGSCARTHGQHCDAIWTDKSQYTIGDTIQYCYSVAEPAYIQITDTNASGNTQIVTSGNDDGSGACGTGTITPPVGTETLTMRVQSNAGLNTVRTSFRVVSPGCAPTCRVTLTTDKSTYHLGDTIRVCFNPGTPSHVRITETSPNGQRIVLYDQDDDGNGACLSGQAKTSTGMRQLHMDVTVGGQIVGQADTSFQVAADRPGGTWISPQDGSTTSGIVTFSAHAYSANSGDPPIDHVNFTVWWPALGPQSGPWRTACTGNPTAGGDIYTCTADLGALGAPAGQVLMSFDVYDQSGGSNLSPNGEHTIRYLPQVSSPTNTPVPTSTPIATATAPPTATQVPTPIPTDTPTPPTHHNVLVFVQGVCSTLKSGSGSVSDTQFAELRSRLESQAHYPSQDLLEFSYGDGAMRKIGTRWVWVHNAYGEDDLISQSLRTSSLMLDTMLLGYHRHDPGARFILVGHSLGGVVAVNEALDEGKGSARSLGLISRVITIDSPLYGVTTNFGRIVRGLNLATLRLTKLNCAVGGVAANDLVSIFHDTNRGVSLYKLWQRSTVKFLPFGNRYDCLFAPGKCGIPLDGDLNTQWVNGPTKQNAFSLPLPCHKAKYLPDQLQCIVPEHTIALHKADSLHILTQAFPSPS